MYDRVSNDFEVLFRRIFFAKKWQKHVGQIYHKKNPMKKATKHVPR